MTLIKNEATGYSVNVPDNLTVSQIDGIRLVVYHNVRSCNPEYSRHLLEMADAIRSAKFHMERAVAALVEDGRRFEANGLRSVLERLNG